MHSELFRKEKCYLETETNIATEKKQAHKIIFS